MKTILAVLFVSLSTMMGPSLQETEKMNGTYAGYEDGRYIFTDSDGYKTEFNYISEEVSQKFDLTDEKYIDKQFVITFTIDSEMDEDDEEIQVSTIVGLVMPQ